MKTTLMVLSLILSSTICSFSQAVDISGIMHVQGVNEEYNSICIRFDQTLIADDQSIIQKEFAKYQDIVSISFNNEVSADYVFVKYANPMTPNQLLAILDRINKKAHYMESGSAVYYQKDGSIYFIR